MRPKVSEIEQLASLLGLVCFYHSDDGVRKFKFACKSTKGVCYHSVARWDCVGKIQYGAGNAFKFLQAYELGLKAQLYPR